VVISQAEIWWADLRDPGVRALERGTIAADDQDRATFVARLGAVAGATSTTLYAWALLPNHAHLLLRSGPAGLPRFIAGSAPGTPSPSITGTSG
jgi:hypothetical protein